MFSPLKMLGISKPDHADAVLYAQIIKASEKMETSAAKLCLDSGSFAPDPAGEGDEALRETLEAMSYDELLSLSGRWGK